MPVGFGPTRCKPHIQIKPSREALPRGSANQATPFEGKSVRRHGLMQATARVSGVFWDKLEGLAVVLSACPMNSSTIVISFDSDQPVVVRVR